MIDFSDYKPKPFPHFCVLISLLFLLCVVLMELTPQRAQMIQLFSIITDRFLPQFRSDVTEGMRLILAIFIHGNWLHWAGNYFIFLMLAFQLERELGNGKFLTLFLVSGVAGNLAAMFYLHNHHHFLMGSSGAISGLIGTWLVLYPHKRINFVLPIGLYLQRATMPISIIILVWFTIQLLLQFQPDPVYKIAWISHITGFTTGFLLGWFVK